MIKCAVECVEGKPFKSKLSHDRAEVLLAHEAPDFVAAAADVTLKRLLNTHLFVVGKSASQLGQQELLHLRRAPQPASADARLRDRLEALPPLQLFHPLYRTCQMSLRHVLHNPRVSGDLDFLKKIKIKMIDSISVSHDVITRHVLVVRQTYLFQRDAGRGVAVEHSRDELLRVVGDLVPIFCGHVPVTR